MVSETGITEVLPAPRSPWQNPFAERLVGSIRRECSDHVIVLGDNHLRRILKNYFDYYLGSRTHLSLAKDAPTSRVVQGQEAGDCGDPAGRRTPPSLRTARCVTDGRMRLRSLTWKTVKPARVRRALVGAKARPTQ
ncbi:MAG TPA: integrase core domain-containing protein [Terriglobia bacterium]|nr:integrase core domain-containing protein [Terriglobia bacterium]